MHVTLNISTDDNSSVENALYYLSTNAQLIHRLILFIYFIFGFVGSTFNIFLFMFSILSRVSSSRYLLSASIANLLVTIFVIPFRLLADGFDRDLTAYSLFSCQMVSYLYYVFLSLSPLFEVLATADRWAASCVQVTRRRFASIRIAKRLIGVIIILPCIFYSHVFVTFNQDPEPPPPYCSLADYYAVSMLVVQLIVYSIIPPFCLAFFSIQILHNVTRRHLRIAPVAQLKMVQTGTKVVRRGRFNQMQIMLVCQAIVECVLTLPFSIVNLASLVVDNDAFFLTVYSFVRLMIFFNYVSSFYIYMLSSKLYRAEFWKLAKRLRNRFP